MIARCTAILLVVGLLLIVVPIHAAERITTLPPVAPLSSGRFDVALALNKQVLGYGQGEFGGSAAHVVFVDATQDMLIEVVVIEDRVYVRQGVQERWIVTSATAGALPVGGPMAPGLPMNGTVPLEGGELFRLGDATVAGAPTVQYQFMLDPATLPAQLPVESGVERVKADLFVGQNDNYLHKLQVTVLGSTPETGPIEMEVVMVFANFNQPVVVGPPPAHLVDQLQTPTATQRYQSLGSRVLPHWSQPLFARGLGALRASR
ncbi:MAG: hypothetical protein M3R24_38015 [Chloroflexota bacterium]|nr:hypothetical protein [Chloroflexota bacterium]